MSPYFQPDHLAPVNHDHAAPVIQELFEWLPKHFIDGTNGPSAKPNRPFMPLLDLQDYLKAEKRTTKLLRALSVEGVHQGLIELLEKYYIRVFIILTRIGKGRYIEHFVQHQNLRDPRLPFLEKPAHFPIDPNDPTFWDKFYENQFAFCPHYFCYNENSLKLEDHCVLPIISKEVLGHGGSAAIYKIKLHPQYDQLSPDGEAVKAYSARPANTYVLKTYNTKDADKYYANEVDAFMKLSKKGVDENLIKLLGSYKQGDTYNILLEYADRGTLEDFFQTTPPPSLGEEIIVFWSRLFNVIKALQRIHATERPDGFCGPDILIGWHQDVKPKNILVLSGNGNSPYDVEFKLGDLGLSHFKRTLKLDRKIVDSDVGGTKDYGAPECHRSDAFLEQIKLNVKPSIDIWSFGGVCSEAAVWVVLGMPGLNDYRHRRQQEICEKGTSQDGSCFHDGEKVLQSVEIMHERLLRRGEIRPGDHVTRPVLDQMVPVMLEEDPDVRHPASALWKRSTKIVDEATKKLIKSNQQTEHASLPVGSNAQYYETVMPTTPPHRVVQPYHENTHGAPPHRFRHRLNLGTSGRSSFLEQRRSGTWHGRNTNPDMTSSPLDGSPSPPIANQQRLGASPPVDIYSDPQERPELYGTTSDQTKDVFEAEILHAVRSMPYSSPNGLRNVHQNVRDLPPPENNVDARFRSSGTYVEAQLENDLQHSKLAGASTGYEHFPIATDTTSGQASQRPQSKSQIAPSMANTPSAAAAVELPAQTTKPEKPHLSFADAKQIRIERRPLRPEHQGLLNDLKTRDHVFLIDDSLSMERHWDDVVSLFHVLAYFAKRLDSNALEMYFTVSTDVKTFKKTSEAVSHLKTMSQNTYSNIDSRLQQILGKYQEDLVRKSFFGLRAKVKPLSLYVFTDAAWQGCDAIAPIEAMIQKQRQLGLPKEQVSIQFIRFGSDANGIKKLKYLDSGLRRKHTKKWDIVDTEPFQGGNMLKMLVGATFDWFDDDDDDDD